MEGWKSDKRWADQFLPQCKRILGEHLIGEAPVEEDQERNTDLIVLRLEAVRIGCRFRRPETLRGTAQDGTPYFDQFTIRTSRPNGKKTELGKIIEGWGDYFFYGIVNEEETDFACWTLGRLNIFRGWFNRWMANHAGAWPGHGKKNVDGSSEFLAFNMRELPSDFFVARLAHEPWAETATPVSQYEFDY